MISIIEREVVDKKNWLGREEFLDLLAVAQSMPGILAVNISVVSALSTRGQKSISKPVRRCRNISRDCSISYKLQNLHRRARILLYCEWHV